MKSNLILLLLLVSLIVTGQTVPNTTTFSLQNVVDVVNPTTDDLVDCFSDANATYFNTTYEGSKNSLLNFRDYGPHNICPSMVSISTPSEANSTSLDVAYPSTVAGDILIINVLQNSTSTLTMTTSGWTSTGSATTTGKRYSTWYKRLTATTSGGTANFTTGSSQIFGGVCIKISKTTSLVKNGSGIGSSTNSYLVYSVIAGDNCQLGVEIFGTFSGAGSTLSAALGWNDVGQVSTTSYAWRIASYAFSQTISTPKNTYNFSGTVYYCFEQFEIH